MYNFKPHVYLVSIAFLPLVVDKPTKYKALNLRHIISYTALFTLLLMLVGSIWYYQERMYFIDPCWVTYQILNTGNFCFGEYRYGAFITQIFPLLASYAHLPLSLVLLGYSVSFYIFYLGAFWMLVYYYRQLWLGLLLLFYLTLLVSHVYFWPNNEVHQGIAWMLLFLGHYLHMLDHQKRSITTYLIGTLLLFFAIINHLLVSIPLAFLWAFLHADNIRLYLKNKTTLYFSVVIVAFIGLRYALSQHGYYDSGKLHAINHLNLESIYGAFTNAQATWFLHALVADYWVAIPLLLASIWAIISTKKYGYLLPYFGALVGYFALVCITYPEPVVKENLFYFESEWMGLALILATPLLYTFYRFQRLQPLVLALVIATSLTAGARILAAAPYFQERYSALTKQVDELHQQGVNKAIFIQPDSVSNAKYMMSWGLAAESLIYSAAHHIEPNISYMTAPDKERFISNDSLIFYHGFGKLPIKDLNPHYFHLDKHQEYRIFEKE